MSELSNDQHAETLLIDIGNTRIKYAKSLPNAPLKVATTDNVQSVLQHNPSIKKVIMGSVKSNELTQKTFQQCQSLGIQLVNVQTESQRFGIQCAYKDFHNLGVDRWLAVLAARLHTELPVAIIDAGTAMTCDLVVGQKHLGGWIAPGFTMMRDAVTTKTDKVFGNQKRPNQLLLGDTTEDCVNFGCMAMLQGMLTSAQKILESHASEYRIYVCGGDQDLIEYNENEKIQLKPDLVLEGLARYAD